MNTLLMLQLLILVDQGTYNSRGGVQYLYWYLVWGTLLRRILVAIMITLAYDQRLLEQKLVTMIFSI